MMPKEDNIFMPMLALSLLVLSALVMAFLFLSEPVKLYLEDQKKEAFSFFTKMIACFACFVIIFLILVFIF
ncbi:MAG: hypothetical protein NDI62_02590 [Burkholderiales bacterium]|nr:hypothetical protein [Burkholderiales bacterium]